MTLRQRHNLNLHLTRLPHEELAAQLALAARAGDARSARVSLVDARLLVTETVQTFGSHTGVVRVTVTQCRQMLRGSSGSGQHFEPWRHRGGVEVVGRGDVDAVREEKGDLGAGTVWIDSGWVEAFWVDGLPGG